MSVIFKLKISLRYLSVTFKKRVVLLSRQHIKSYTKLTLHLLSKVPPTIFLHPSRSDLSSLGQWSGARCRSGPDSYHHRLPHLSSLPRVSVNPHLRQPKPLIGRYCTTSSPSSVSTVCPKRETVDLTTVNDYTLWDLLLVQPVRVKCKYPDSTTPSERTKTNKVTVGRSWKFGVGSPIAEERQGFKGLKRFSGRRERGVSGNKK